MDETTTTTLNAFESHRTLATVMTVIVLIVIAEACVQYCIKQSNVNGET